MKEQEKRVADMCKEELISEYKELPSSAVRDTLTGLLKRDAFEKELSERMEQKKPGEQCALIMVDLDNFKTVNERFTKQAGDEILVQTAKRLSGMFYAADIVGRLGGDEFVVFLCGKLTETMLNSKGEKICEELRFEIDEENGVVVTASVGICFDESGENDFETLCRHAYAAVCEVKKNGKNGYCINASGERMKNLKGTLLPKTLMNSIVVQASGNLTSNVMYSAYADGEELPINSDICKCSEFFEKEIGRIYVNEESRAYIRLLTREAMLRLYQRQGNSWFVKEYRRTNANEKMEWVSCVFNIYEDRNSGEVLFALWTSSIEKRRQWESMFKVPIYKEPISKLYTGLTVREICTKLLEMKEEKLCALVVIELNGIDRLNKENKLKTERKWNTLVTAMLVALGTQCIPGQISMGKLVVYFPKVLGEEMLKSKIEQAFKFVRNVTADVIDGSSLRFTAGGACAYCNKTSYRELADKAQKQCEYCANEISDCVAFADTESNDELLHKSQTAETVKEQKVFTESEQAAAVECFMRMFDAQTLEEKAECVLSTAGEFYNADRVYVLETTEKGQVVDMVYEWTAVGKRSLKNAIAGTPTKMFPLIIRCVQENQPIFLSRKKLPRQDGETEEMWYFAVFPMYDGEHIESFLCLENGKNTEADAEFTKMLIDCLQKERHRIINKKTLMSDISEVSYTNLPNYKSFLEVIFGYNSDVYNSLGVVCTDIPNLSELNSTKGFGYGHELMTDLTKSLVETFGQTMVYRTWDAEFTALCPNSTQESFSEKYARLYSMLKKKYPTDVRVGTTWSDKIFNGKSLVDEAKLIMRCDKTAVSKSDIDKLPSSLSRYGSVREMIGAKRFTVCYQPKVDMENGEIVGAEALVRAIDENGRIIMPEYFVEELERSATIRDVDLYVLDCAMRMLTKWQEEGIAPIPISVNFSQTTLFDPRVPASIMAIQSRYPEFKEGTIEIELREKVGKINKEAMTEIMEMYRGMGLHFAMDDFGSKYSNLAVFTSIRFDTVKLDKSLVNEIVYNDANRLLVKEMINICRRNNINCIAEGVETMDQMRELMRLGAKQAQGYYFHQPLPPDLLKHKLSERKGNEGKRRNER